MHRAPGLSAAVTVSQPVNSTTSSSGLVYHMPTLCAIESNPSLGSYCIPNSRPRSIPSRRCNPPSPPQRLPTRLSRLRKPYNPSLVGIPSKLPSPFHKGSNPANIDGRTFSGYTLLSTKACSQVESSPVLPVARDNENGGCHDGGLRYCGRKEERHGVK